MKAGRMLQTFTLLFGAVLILYLIGFHGLEHLRQRRGPWEVHFLSGPQGTPSIVVYQPRLNISSVEILFLGEQLPSSNQVEKVRFDQPLQTLPFGQVIYEDLTFLPGVVTFELFGHEIELLPRVLLVNKQEIPWRPDTLIELAETNKPAVPPRPPKGSNQ